MATTLTLDAAHTRGDDTDTFDLHLAFPPGLFDAESQLVLTSVMRLVPLSGSARLVERVGSRTVIAPSADHAGLTDAGWRVPDVRCEFRARHANDGPASAYVISGTGEVHDVVVRASSTTMDAARIVPWKPATDTTVPVSPADDIGVIPVPRRLRSAGATTGHTARLVESAGPAGRAWDAVASLAVRLGRGQVLTDIDTSDSVALSWTLDSTLGHEEYRLTIDGAAASIAAATEAGFRHGFVTIAQWLSHDARTLDVVDRPAHAMRVVHLDLARRWFEPATVLRLIDVAAWRKFSHVHLHLTDDESWRVPVSTIPDLAALGGTRGHGRAIGALCGSGAAPYGRCYTPHEIGEWVQRADSLGITLIPEVDVPGHSHAALAALPQLRDPDDRSGASSIQGFVDNVLVPGHERNDWLIDSVFGAIADLFPTSPHLHVGGDEVPRDAWKGSPIARRFAAAHGIQHAQLHATFVRSIIDRVRSSTGRKVAVWEEAATSGALRPDDGYAVAWTSPDAARTLATAGFDVVVSPGQAYYLDMAASTDWSAPGASWAGHVPLERTVEFRPGDGWPNEAIDRLLGVQACIWSEHIATTEILDGLAFPRLDAIADRAWRGPESTMPHRSDRRDQPTFSHPPDPRRQQ